MRNKDQNKFQLIKFLENYIKHPTLLVELTLKDGRKAILKHNRSIIEGSVSCLVDTTRREIPINNIRKADVFSV